MKRIIAILPFILLLLYGCNNDIEIVNPPVDPTGFLGETTPLPPESKAVMEGVYAVTEGTELLGDQVVVKWTRERLSIFSGRNGGYIILDGGSLDSVLFFLGYWRYATGSETGTANFYISSAEGGRGILDGDTALTAITLTGSYGEGTESAGRRITLRYARPFSPAVKASRFEIMAHRGGGRNSEYLGVSENSIEMIAFAERFGTTGVEIDLRLSKDGVPFLYHDNDVNLRLTQKGPIWGNIEDFTWAQLRTLVTLRNGEKIPSAEEALTYILDHTTLRKVWLDTKDVDVLPASIAIQREVHRRALEEGRDLEVYIGLPSQDVYDAFVATPGHDTIPSLCELSTDLARQSNSRVWAPRWTEGTQTASVEAMHAEGRLAFVWTLDDARYIEEFVNNSQFDAVLTNYPTILSYYHYIR
jgi:glycerophosphoryl diester phosphodiesterase